MSNETKMTDETKIILLQKCLETCQLFGEKCFKISVSMEGFNFTMNHGLVEKSKKTKKKYVSPSTRRRNNMRLQAFKAKKAESDKTPSSEEISPLEPPGVGGSPPGSLPGEDEEINTRDDPTNLETRRVDVPLVVAVDVHPPPIPPPFQCDICGQNFGKRAGLNGHIRKKHEQIEQIDGAQSDDDDTTDDNATEDDTDDEDPQMKINDDKIDDLLKGLREMRARIDTRGWEKVERKRAKSSFFFFLYSRKNLYPQ